MTAFVGVSSTGICHHLLIMFLAKDLFQDPFESAFVSKVFIKIAIILLFATFFAFTEVFFCIKAIEAILAWAWAILLSKAK